MPDCGFRGFAFEKGTYLEFIIGNLWRNPCISARGLWNCSVKVIPGRLVRPSRRIPQMHKEVVSCFGRWHGRDVQIHGKFPTCDCYPSRPTRCRLQQVDLNNLHPLRWVEAFCKKFALQLNECPDTVLLCNDDIIIGGRQKKIRETTHMKHCRYDPVTYLVIAMQSRSQAPQGGLP